MKQFIFLSLLVISLPLFAQVDATVSGSYRSYPLSGILEGEVGYGLPVWGTPDKENVAFGYIRPSLLLGTAINYNSAQAALDVFPISILGVRGGGEYITNNKGYEDHDCVKYNCTGTFNRQFVEVELSAGYWNIFARGKWRRENWRQGDQKDGDFIDPTSSLAANYNGDTQTVWQGLIGYKFTEMMSFLYVHRAWEMENRFARAQSNLALVRYVDGLWAFTAGGGEFKSKEQLADLSFILQISWQPLPSIAL